MKNIDRNKSIKNNIAGKQPYWPHNTSRSGKQIKPIEKGMEESGRGKGLCDMGVMIKATPLTA